MCGIAGFIDFARQTSADVGLSLAENMAAAIRHRGPDDGGTWCDASQGMFLAHRRLSIVDLSAAGHQPMASLSGRYVIVFNGEVYNHGEIRQQLAGVAWRGNSDTEVMLAAIEQWGLEAALQQFVGMFAFALWDRQTASLTLVRDRFGEKPLYWGQFGSMLLFGSELKAMKQHPAFVGAVNRDALAGYMAYGYLPGSASIYEHVQKLKPASMRVFHADGSSSEQVYWSAVDAALSGRANEFEGDDTAAANQLENLIAGSVRQQLLADVPVGAFLSGGVDSSTIVALAQAHSRSPVKTFTIGFEEAGYNEAVYAEQVAKHLGTDHTELYVSHQDALSVIPELPELYDEPFADSSQIPTFLVSKLARSRVAVSLSGDAGDELFCGYKRYKLADRLWQRSHQLPSAMRQVLAAGLKATPIAAWDAVGTAARKLKPGAGIPVHLGDKMHKFARVLVMAGDSASLYESLLEQWQGVDGLVTGAQPVTGLTSDAAVWRGDLDLKHRMMLLDTTSYLTDDILVKVDRAAMGVSLESRVPLLDHRIYEFAWKLPMHMKMRDGQGKWLLRQVLYRYVPRELIERPKVGFAVPIGIWLRGPLKDWAAGLLAPSRLNHEGYLDAARVTKMWDEHQQGHCNWQYPLWCVLMFQAWLEKNGS
ncbi:MAG: asparagine synthase (glutamine-hydrolyzing) [Fluviibacter phosphoraccumulans]